MKNTSVIAVLVLLIICPVFASAADNRNVEIIVAEKDYMIHICQKYLSKSVYCPDIIRLNNLKNANLIHPGQKLTIPVKLLKGLPSDASAAFVKGYVAIRSKADTEWAPLRIGDNVREGFSIKTGPESAVELVFEDETSMFIKADTVMDLSVSRKSPLHFVRELFLSAGSAITKLRAATGQVKSFDIRTPSAVATARGTQYRTSVDNDNSMRSEVLEGKVDVEAMKLAVQVNKGEGTLVKKGERPLAPRKLLMPPIPLGLETIYKSFPMQLHFSRIEGAASYKIVMTRDKEIKDILKEGVIMPDAVFETSGLQDGYYYLQSTSIDSLGIEGLPLEPVAIKVRLNPLPPFTSEPANNSELRQQSVNFSWMKVPDAEMYNLQIAEDADFNNIVSEVHIRDTQYKASLDYKAYFFRIRSIAADEYYGAWSDVQRVTLLTPPPAPPLDEPLMDGSVITLRWKNLGSTIRYHFQMAKDADFSEILIDKQIETSDIVLQKPDKPGIYFVRTSAVDGSSYEGAFSPPQSFEIKRAFPYEVLGIVGIISAIVLAL